MTGGEQAILVVAAVGEAIRELAPVPNGVLYAAVMGKLRYDQYVGIINVLAAAGLIKVNNNIIMWVGGGTDISATVKSAVGDR